MIEEARIVEAIKGSGVKSVVLLDDAFDPPAFQAKYAADLLTYLDDANNAGTLTAAGLAAADVAAMRTALETTEYKSEAIASGVERLYRRYRASNRSTKADPGGMFGDLKGAILTDLAPLITLLGKCSGVAVKELGKGDDIAALESVDVIFADYYLLSPGEAVGEDNPKAAEDSYKRVISLVDKAAAGKRPSVILMSSMAVKERAESYRAQIRKEGAEEDLIYASSFGFVLKTGLKGVGARIEISEEAADVLLDVFQAFEFGRTIHASLSAWFTAAHTAVDRLQRDVAKLQLREFAYLTKFRLMDEGEPLLEYLEWFFAECLSDGIAKEFDGKPQVPELSEIIKQAKRIEGAFDGPTKMIAELYHRVRIASPKTAFPPANYRLGDLFLEKDNSSITAIMTPECDLVLRKGKRKVERLLTVSGLLRPINTPESVMSEFILIGNGDGQVLPYSIAWNLKSIDNRPTAEKLKDDEDPAERLPAPGKSTDHWTYVGSLRPLYAQELQKDLLVDLGRSSIPVGPALAMAAICELAVATQENGVKVIPTLGVEVAHCWAIPSERKGALDKKPKLVFNRTYVSALLKALVALPEGLQKPPEELTPAKQAAFYARLCLKGVELGDRCFGIQVVSKAPAKATGGDFAWLVVKSLDVAPEEAKVDEQKSLAEEAIVAERFPVVEAIKPINTEADKND